jgi:hypothetical protein
VDPITGRPAEEPTTSDPPLARIEHLTNLIDFL